MFVLFLMKPGITEPIQGRKLAMERKALYDTVKPMARKHGYDLLQSHD